jgi:hypothetical protein
MDDHLAKPFSQAAMFDALTRVSAAGEARAR